MKVLFIIFFIATAIFQYQKVSAQTANKSDTTRKYFAQLAASANNADKELLQNKLYALLRSNREQDWFLAIDFFYQLKMQVTVDSLEKAIKQKFPKGISVRNEAATLIYDEKDAAKKEALYKSWIKKFPPAEFGSDRIQYDYARSAVANAYGKEDNVKKALQYADMIETQVWKGEGWASTAYIIQAKGHLKEAGVLFKKARDNSYRYLVSKKSDNGARFAASGFASYCNSLAENLYRQKKYTEALQYAREAHDSSANIKANVNANYSNILIALGRDKEAFDIINEAVKEGQATVEMKQNLEQLYIKVKGSREGYDEFLVSMNKILAEKTRKEVAWRLISKPAAMFTLKDIDGNIISLEDYKGKTVILDFWATWCGPCKKSFPAMKMAVNKYKDDPNVKFLFIHTWERQDSASYQAKKFITDNNYPFEVLMDLKDAETGLNKVVDSYKVTSIPAKFIIDKNGNIRFSLSGFSGGDDAAVEEISAMIQLVN